MDLVCRTFARSQSAEEMSEPGLDNVLACEWYVYLLAARSSDNAVPARVRVALRMVVGYAQIINDEDLSGVHSGALRFPTLYHRDERRNLKVNRLLDKPQRGVPELIGEVERGAPRAYVVDGNCAGDVERSSEAIEAAGAPIRELSQHQGLSDFITILRGEQSRRWSFPASVGPATQKSQSTAAVLDPGQ